MPSCFLPHRQKNKDLTQICFALRCPSVSSCLSRNQRRSHHWRFPRTIHRALDALQTTPHSPPHVRAELICPLGWVSVSRGRILCRWRLAQARISHLPPSIPGTSSPGVDQICLSNHSNADLRIAMSRRPQCMRIGSEPGLSCVLTSPVSGATPFAAHLSLFFNVSTTRRKVFHGFFWSLFLFPRWHQL